MTSSFCISVVLFLLFCQKLNLAKETINPQCTPANGFGNESAIDFIFLLDQSLGEDKVSRIRYLLKAISCEIPTSKHYRLATVHVSAKPLKVHLTGWKTSADFPDTLFEESPQDGSSDPCVVLHSALKEVEAQFVGRVPALGEHQVHFVVPVTERNGCKVESVFRKFFATNWHRFNIYLDIIAIETPMKSTDAGVRVRVPSWVNIETKVKSLTTHTNFDDIYKMDTFLQEYSGWIKNLLQGLQVNDMILLDDTAVTVQHRSTIEAKTGKKKDTRSNISRKTDTRSTLPEKMDSRLTTSEKITDSRAVTGVRAARQISPPQFALPHLLVEISRNTSADRADAVQLNVKHRHGRSSHTSSTANSEALSTQSTSKAKRASATIAEMLARLLFQSDTAQDAQNASLHDVVNAMALNELLRKNSTTSAFELISGGEIYNEKLAAPNAPQSHREYSDSSGINWKRFFVPLLIFIILLALILIFVLLCCLYLIRAEREHVPSGRSIAGAEKSPLIVRRSSGNQSPAVAEAPVEEKIEAIKLTSKEEVGDEAPPKEPNTADFSPIFISMRAADQRRIIERGPKGGFKPLSSTDKTGRAPKESAISMSEDTPATDYPSVQPPHINTDHMF